MPEKRACVGVVCIDAVFFADDEYDVMRHAADGDVGEIERFGIHFAVGGKNEKFSERGRIDIGGVQNGFCEVLAGASVVVVIGQHILRGRGKDRKQSED